MALRWFDGFETYGDVSAYGEALVSELRRKYDTVVIYTGGGTNCAKIDSGWGFGKCLWSYRTDDYDYLVKSFDDQDTWIIGFALKTPAIFDTRKLFQLDKSLAAMQGQITCSLGYGGQVIVSLAGSTVIGQSSTTLKPSTWYYIEVKVKIHATTGTVDIQINGVNTCSLSNQNTKGYAFSGYADCVTVYISQGNGACIDDLYVADGSAGVNTFLGPGKIEVLRPTGDNSVAWTPSANADHYTLVDDNTLPSSTDYVSSATVNETDLWSYSDLTYITGDIQGVIVNTVARLETAGSLRDLETICSSNGTQSNGSDYIVSDDGLSLYTRLLLTDPDTANAWDVSGINAALFGVKVGD